MIGRSWSLSSSSRQEKAGTRSAGRADLLARWAQYSPQEQSLLEAISQDPGDKQAIDAKLEDLPPASDGSLSPLIGDWKADWSSMEALPAVLYQAPKFLRDFARAVAFKQVPLNFLSFGALPWVNVQITRSFNRIVGSMEEGGGYDLYQIFTVPGSEGVEAAMVLQGSFKKNTKAQSRRVPVQFESVMVLPSTTGTDESTEMLAAAGLGEFVRKAVSLEAKRTFIDIEHLSESLRVHKGESGVSYVLSRLEEKIPFA